MSTPTDGSQVTNTASYPAASNLVKSFTHGNGLATTNTHSLDYEQTRCTVTDGGLALIDKSYARSDKLNITSITDAVAAGNSQSLWYNKSNRLQNADGPWGAKTFYYDGTGNRTYEITGSVTDTLGYPGGSNRIADVVSGLTTTRTFTHDGAGNITTDTRSGSAYTFGYNARGRLATVHQDGNLKGSYVYNSLEQLASRAVTNSGPFNGTVHTVQDRSGNILAEADGTTGVVAKEYIWLPGAGYAGTDLPVGVVDVAGTATPELLYVHADHLSRPIRLTDAAKITAWAVEWLPWGGVHSITGSETLNARFPGQWFQVESGLHYNWHRHYDPTIGRYTQPDPLGFVDGPSVYAYAGNRPGEEIDPDGRAIQAIGAICRLIPAACSAIVQCARNPSKCKELVCKQIQPKSNRAPQSFGNLAMHQVCDVPGCKGGDAGDSSLAFRAAAAEACLILRRLQNLCHQTPSKSHDDEVIKSQQKAAECRRQCKARF